MSKKAHSLVITTKYIDCILIYALYGKLVEIILKSNQENKYSST